jgi:hypothetical protein
LLFFQVPTFRTVAKIWADPGRKSLGVVSDVHHFWIYWSESLLKMFVGSFAGNFTGFQKDVAAAIGDFKAKGLTKLLIDKTNN